VTTTDELLQNNLDHARSSGERNLPGTPAKRVAVLACMDARMDIHKILGLNEGDAHVIRNAGGLPTDDAIRSLLISQRKLGTEEILLIHHTDCGMLKIEEEEIKKELEEEVGVAPHFDLGAISDLETSLRKSIQDIKSSPFLPNTDSVRGFIYDVSTGLLEEIR
jgi:carbonic anhydrase